MAFSRYIPLLRKIILLGEKDVKLLHGEHGAAKGADINTEEIPETVEKRDLELSRQKRIQMEFVVANHHAISAWVTVYS